MYYFFYLEKESKHKFFKKRFVYYEVFQAIGNNTKSIAIGRTMFQAVEKAMTCVSGLGAEPDNAALLGISRTPCWYAFNSEDSLNKIRLIQVDKVLLFKQAWLE